MKKLIIATFIVLSSVSLANANTTNFNWCTPVEFQQDWFTCMENFFTGVDGQVKINADSLANHKINLNYPHKDFTLPPDVIGISTSTGLESDTSVTDNDSQAGTAFIVMQYTATTISDFKEYILRIKRKYNIGPGDVFTSYTTFYTTETSHNFTNLIPGSEYTINVAVIDNSGNQSNWSTDFVQVASVDSIPPIVPANVTATSGFKSVLIRFNANAEPDIAGYEVHISTTSGFTPDPSSLISKGLTNIVTFNGLGSTTYYVKVAAFDQSGNLSPYSAQVSTTTSLVATADIDSFAIDASKIFTKIPIITGDAWTDNSPSAGLLAWNAHTLVYNGVSYAISAGNTTTVPNDKYIYWNGFSSFYNTSLETPTLTDGQFIIATNINGVHDLAWNSLANQVIGSAFIADAAITNAKISDLSADKINTGFLAAGRIQADSLDLSKLNFLGDDLILNSFFTNDVNNWQLTDSNFGGLSLSSNFATEGVNSLLLSTGPGSNSLGGVCSFAINVIPGEFYTIRLNVKGSLFQTNALRIRMAEKATLPAGNYVNAAEATSYTNFILRDSNTEWKSFDFTYKAPVGVNYVSLTVDYLSTSISSTYIDEVHMMTNLTTVQADQLRTGTIGAETINLTDNKFVLNGINQTMVIKDEVGTERIKIGKLGGNPTDYGMQIKNDAGVNIFNATGDISQAELTTGSINAGLITAGTLTVDSVGGIGITVNNGGNIFYNAGGSLTFDSPSGTNAYTTKLKSSGSDFQILNSGFSTGIGTFSIGTGISDVFENINIKAQNTMTLDTSINPGIALDPSINLHAGSAINLTADGPVGVKVINSDLTIATGSKGIITDNISSNAILDNPVSMGVPLRLVHYANQAAAPVCNAVMEGAIVWGTNIKQIIFCNGTSWSSANLSQVVWP